MSRVVFGATLLAVCMVVSGCLSPQPVITDEFFGVVEDSEGRPLAGVTIQYVVDGAVETVQTDRDGSWQAGVLLLGGTEVEFTPMLTAWDFEPASITLSAGQAGVDFDAEFTGMFYDGFNGMQYISDDWTSHTVWNLPGDNWFITTGDGLLQNEGASGLANIEWQPALDRDGVVFQTRLRMNTYTNGGGRHHLRFGHRNYQLSFALPVNSIWNGLRFADMDVYDGSDHAGSMIYMDTNYAVPLDRWFDVKMVFEADDWITLFIDGVQVFRVQDDTYETLDQFGFYTWTTEGFDVEYALVTQLTE